MKGAKSSKIMFPFGRRVHLYKSASFKTIFEKISTNQKNDDTNHPKKIEQAIKKNSNK